MPPTRVAVIVDDNPSNNADIAASAERAGVQVHMAVSTSDALRLLASLRSDSALNIRVITDMHRIEDGQHVTDAGARLIRTMQDRQLVFPTLVFCGERSAATFSSSYPTLNAKATANENVVKDFALFEY
ncbi:hypothetical protein BCR33DRAFT_842871 [Rhizoclosmatium globosum]|uniref:Response regulatory domain-containing protein n=1 Tax=Rhizoclosmatium globosum TaxID=329046 RepID=A0A1Y2CQY9_9FUNG|nr:hypothetical protein BCR33DRAFT_842871 [Rhizoclosmatium globosum]|eukprot:ORY49377.1 hypothetical protein BCR33DRAFT_842871 [Rhizoclosmatium globosum]